MKEWFAKHLVIFDLDETLFHYPDGMYMYVRDKEHNIVKTITSQQYYDNNLEPDQYYDFGDFRSSKIFAERATPIVEMIQNLRAYVAGGCKVEIMTARTDFDDKELFAATMLKHKIDIKNDVHVRRAGNLGLSSSAENKAVFLNCLLESGEYKKLIFYDDSIQNLIAIRDMIKSKYPYPNIEHLLYQTIYDGVSNVVDNKRIL